MEQVFSHPSPEMWEPTESLDDMCVPLPISLWLPQGLGIGHRSGQGRFPHLKGPETTSGFVTLSYFIWKPTKSSIRNT